MPRQSVPAAEALHAVALFHDLSPDELAALAAQTVRRRTGRNELIFSQGESGDGLYLVMQGQVGISRQSAEGDELLIGVCVPGEYFGELALFDEEPRSAAATALEECELLFLGRNAFRSFVEQHPASLMVCLRVVIKQLRRCTELVDELALLDVRSRLARKLLQLAGQEDGTVRITQQQLANMLGATRESVNKHLNALVDGGLISLQRGRVVVQDRTRLEACSLGLS